MIASATMYARRPEVVSRGRDVVRLLGSLREQARAEVELVWADVPGKRINCEHIPGFGRQGISRAIHGCESNPVFRLPGWFVLGRRIGVPKERFQRILDWLQQKLDEAYADVPPRPLTEVLDREEELDGRDGAPQQRAYRGCPAAARELLEIKRDELALLPDVIRSLEVAAGGAE